MRNALKIEINKKEQFWTLGFVVRVVKRYYTTISQISRLPFEMDFLNLANVG